MRQAAAASVQARRVLVVDDSLTLRELRRKLLAGRGHAVTVAVAVRNGRNQVMMSPA